jgi:uncharacterized membrane protein YraQ (UPF0718 family)
MKIFDSNFWIVFGLLVVLGALAWGRGGAPFVGESLTGGMRLFVRFGPVIALSFLVAGLAEALMPREWVASALGEDSGLRGLLFASAAGAVTPAGPFISMPLAAGLLRTGAAPPAVVTFLAAWSLISIHRLFAWELPILGASFAFTRWTLCLLVPVAVGALTRVVLRMGAG